MKKLTLFFFMLFSVITHATQDDGPPPPPPTASVDSLVLPMLIIGVAIATYFYIKSNNLKKYKI